MEKIKQVFKYFLKHKEFIIVLIAVAALLIILQKFLKLRGFISNFDTASSIVLAISAFLAYYKYAKENDEIPLYFKVYKKENEGKETNYLVNTELKLLRKDVNRQEILGILGMIQKKSSGRFNNSKLKEKETLLEFLENIRSVQKGKGDKVEIPISEEDLKEHFPHLFK